MQILYHKNFLKNFKKRIAPNKKLSAKFKSQLERFILDSSASILRNHRLIGKKSDFWSFSVTGDIRVVYKIVNSQILLYDIGSHNQVY